MSKEINKGKFQLTVPLDASEIENFKPERGVKVGVQDRNGKIHSAAVRLDAKGQGIASFSFSEHPGALRLIIGPEDASDDELTGLQTLTTNVQARQWQAGNELKLAPIRITPYYWWWWLRWCRTFTINGRVLCPDGSPVPGAIVCAYDVDWWWWWLSQQKVGCATTDATGSFTITFRWCCGWWPWWWWSYRYWRYEPILAEHILPILQRDPTLGKLRLPSPTPDLSVFEDLLLDDRSVERSFRIPTSPTASKFAARAATNRTLAATNQTTIDPTALTSLREKLIKRLPAAPELERLRLWPWWPWEPWWDCTPDIIFKVMQDCVEPNKIIVDENVWQARPDIPTNLNVTLTATDACCIPICLDPADCPEGDCIVITEACGPVSNIGGNFDAVAATPVGYASPGPGAGLRDRPFSDNVPISGVFGSGANVDYYEFEWATSLGGSWNPMPPLAAGGFSRQYWGPQLPAGPVGWHLAPFAFTTISGRNVIETREHYEANNGAGTWGVTRFWGSNRDLLMNWFTKNNFADGTYYLHVRGWELVASNLTNDRILPMCDTEDENYVVLTIDNRMTDGSDGHPPPTTLGSHPCGSGTVHTCTMEPDTDIVNVTIGGQVVGPCTNVQASPGSPLVIDFYAYDPVGHLGQYSLIATWGESLSRDLIGIADSIIGFAGLGVPAAAQVGTDYAAAISQGAASPVWRGGGVRLTINDSSEAFPDPCCYQLELRASKRTIVGCSGGPHDNLSQYSFGVNACPQPE